MKKLLLNIALMLFAVSFVIAATLTVNIPPNDVPRVSDAYGFGVLGLGRGATMQEVSERVRQDIINTTKTYERSSYTPPPLEMQPTPTPTPTASPSPTPTPTPTP